MNPVDIGQFLPLFVCYSGCRLLEFEVRRTFMAINQYQKVFFFLSLELTSWVKDSDRNNSNETRDIFLSSRTCDLAHSKYLKIVNFSMETFKLTKVFGCMCTSWVFNWSPLAAFGMSRNTPKRKFIRGMGCVASKKRVHPVLKTGQTHR